MMHNAFHRDQLRAWGLTPDSVFMCGFFALCSPNRHIVDYYAPFWKRMSEPNLLTIGIKVRLGDHVFKGEKEDQGAALLASVANYFDCAAKVERSYAYPGQKVLWYFISESRILRLEAKRVYGEKLLTDTNLTMVHADCRLHNPDACQQDRMEKSMQHSLGEMITFSLANVHVVSRGSGFGRVGGWLSGNPAAIYELDSQSCSPEQPTPPRTSAMTLAGI